LNGQHIIRECAYPAASMFAPPEGWRTKPRRSELPYLQQIATLRESRNVCALAKTEANPFSPARRQLSRQWKTAATTYRLSRSIRIRFIDKALPRAHFWDHVMTALNSRSITGTQRQQLVQAIAQVVPPPTKADVRREEKALRARFTRAARLKTQVTRSVRGVALEQKPD
jgi:hypothetical protein